MPWGAMAGMAAVSMAMQAQARKEQMKRQQRTSQAEADATRASWMRKDGRGQIPETQLAPGTAWGGMLRAGMGGLQQGALMGNMGKKKKVSTDGGNRMNYNNIGTNSPYNDVTAMG